MLLYYNRHSLTKKWMPGEVMQKQKSINLKKLRLFRSACEKIF